ncbi:MAG: hypothetical protein ABL921_24515 [Pirellula sp.]
MKSRKRSVPIKKDQWRQYFRLMGLARGECRVHVIRSAAQSLSVSLTHSESLMHADVADHRRANIAFATYKLLDPRQRQDFYERIQLVYPIDRDDAEIPVVPANTLIDRMPPMGGRPRVRSGRKRKTEVRLMDQPVIHEAIEHVATVVGKITIDQSARMNTDLSIEERRSIVTALKKSDESAFRGLSPFGWIWTRLGL